MSELVISGYYGFGNAGDEAMLAAMVGALREADPQVRITVLSGNPADTRRRHRVEAIHRLNPWRIVRALAGADLLVSGGGSLLQDVTSGRSIFYYLGIMQLADWLNCPVMLYAQGIGPIRSRLARMFMRHVGNRIAGATVRDAGSQAELLGLGVTKPPVVVTADPVLALAPADLGGGRRILAQAHESGNGPLIGISLREWRGQSHFKEVFAAAADRLAVELGARIVFLPMQWPDDLQAAKDVAGRMRQPYILLDGCHDTETLLSIVGNLDLLVGVRLHALIFAAVMQVPFVGVSYDPKIDRFLETMGEPQAGTLETVAVDSLLQCVHQALAQAETRPQRAGRVERLRTQARRNAGFAMEWRRKRDKRSGVE